MRHAVSLEKKGSHGGEGVAREERREKREVRRDSSDKKS